MTHITSTPRHSDDVIDQTTNQTGHSPTCVDSEFTGYALDIQSATIKINVDPDASEKSTKVTAVKARDADTDTRTPTRINANGGVHETYTMFMCSSSDQGYYQAPVNKNILNFKFVILFQGS